MTTRQPGYVHTVAEARALAPTSAAEVARRRQALQRLRAIAVEDEREIGRPATLEDFLESLRDAGDDA